MYYYVVRTVPTDDQATLGTGASAGMAMSKFRSRMQTGANVKGFSAHQCQYGRLMADSKEPMINRIVGSLMPTTCHIGSWYHGMYY